MIKPIKVDALNMTNHAYFECKNCNLKSEMFLKNKISVDEKNDTQYLNTMPCPNCNKKLGK